MNREIYNIFVCVKNDVLNIDHTKPPPLNGLNEEILFSNPLLRKICLLSWHVKEISLA